MIARADRRGDRLDQDVAVADVRELVGEDAAQLVLGEQFGDPAGDGDRRVLRVAAGREGVGLVLGDHVEARHRQAGARRQFADDLVEPRRLRLLDRLRAAHFQRQFVAEEVGAEVDQQGDAEEERGRAGAADQRADHDQQAGERRQQDRRAQGRAPGGLLGGRHRVTGSLVELPCRKYSGRARFRAIGANPYSRPCPQAAPRVRPDSGVVATVADRRARRRGARRSPSTSSCMRRRFAPLEKLIEEMEKVDLSRPGPTLPPSIDGVGETEEVASDRARLPAHDAAARGRTPPRRLAPRCAPRRRSGRGSRATSTTR